METLSFQSAVTKDDYKELIYFNLFSRHRITAILMGVMALYSCAVLLTRFIWHIQYGFFLYYASVIYLGTLAIIYIQVEWTLKRYVRPNQKTLERKRQYTMSDQGLTIAALGETPVLFPWAAFTKVYETKPYFLLYLDKQQAFLLAKRDMSAELRGKIRKMLAHFLEKRYDRRCR